MEIVIEGWRAGGEERKEANSVPAGELPPLSDAQKEVAHKMGISEEAYARSAFAGKLNQERLFQKTRRFAESLAAKVRSKIPSARIDRIRLVTLEHEYRIELTAYERKILFRVPEEMVNLEGQSVVLHISDAGREALSEVGIVVPNTPGVLFEAREASTYGLWVRMDYSDGQHVLLIRWDYILAVEITVGEIRTEDLVN